MAAVIPALCLAVKPFPALALAAWVALRCPRPLGRLTAAGLVFSAVGDVVLETGLFLPGLLAFLAAHLAYVAAFLAAERRPALGRALPFLAWGLGAFAILRPGLGPMAVPVAVYVAVICTMMWRAAARVGSPGTPALAATLGLAGAVAFGGERHPHRLQPLRRADPRRSLADHDPVLAGPVGHRGVGRARLRYAPRTGEDTMTTTASSSLHVAPVEAIRSRFPALERLHNGTARRLLRRARRHAGARATSSTRWRTTCSTTTRTRTGPTRRASRPTRRSPRRAPRSPTSSAATPSEVAFGANMTTLTFHLGRALGRRWTPGDEIVVTELDHHANVDPWRQLAQGARLLGPHRSGSAPRRASSTWTISPRALGKKTRLLAIGAASNALGTMSDVRRAADLAHAAGALVFVDAVHYAPHALVDVAALGCDFLACSAYKFYGPHVGRAVGPPGPPRGARRARSSSRRPRTRPTGSRPARRTTRASWARPRPSTSSPRWPTARIAGRRLAAAFGGAARAGPAARRGAVDGLARDRRRDALRPAAVASRARPRSRSRCAAGRRRTWRGPSPIAPCSSRTATSTPPRSSAASATPRTASCARAAPATRRSTRWIASSRASRGSRDEVSSRARHPCSRAGLSAAVLLVAPLRFAPAPSPRPPRPSRRCTTSTGTRWRTSRPSTTRRGTRTRSRTRC